MQKKMKKIGIFILSVLSAMMVFVACDNVAPPYADISNTDSSVVDSSSNDNTDSSDNSSDSSNDKNDDDEKDPMDDPLYVYAGTVMDQAELLGVGQSLSGTYELSGTVTDIDLKYSSSVSLYFDVYEPENREMYCYKLKGSGVLDLRSGDFITVRGQIKNYKGMIEFDEGAQLVSVGEGGGSVMPDLSNDPYANISTATFYASYTPAVSAEDAYYRSLHGFMSGDLETPDQAPTLSSYQPKNGNKFIRNSVMNLSEDGKTYTVVDAYGKEAFKVYKDGAYITLEEVAAYVYAFGTYPANYTTSKSTKPTSSEWGKYLRLNHTAFSGDTSSYPYEPVLPNISGCGGTLNYYEMDIGTTGTDCDPSYPIAIYNNGSTITRGAARIVYGKKDLDNDGVYEIGEFHVFYTYNHYNDFQEYLNYEGGWGEKFGNITGGGSISSKYDYNPTDYVEISYEPLPSLSPLALTSFEYYFDDKKSIMANYQPSFFLV